MRYPGALRPLRHPEYRLLAGSLVASLFGTGMLIVAQVWQVVALGGGAGELALVTTIGATGMLLTTLFGGVLADRVPQRHILVAVEAVKALAVGAAATLSVTGRLEVWHLAVAAFFGGVMDGLYYPAYSAWLPALIPATDLLGANGLEGMLRPVLVNAAGPALAGAIVAAISPGAALGASAVASAVAGSLLLPLAATAVARAAAPPGRARAHPVAAVLIDLREGFAYVLRTPWVWATLGFASLMCLLVLGPLEVLVPFAIKDRAGGGPGEHALVLAMFGAGGAVSSLVVASRPLPRRYLTVMVLGWGLGCLPFALLGLTDSVAVMAAAAFVVGACFSGSQVIWGTLLQRRVPPELLGRVSSLDFFVSLFFLPVSMALAVPASVAVGVPATFAIAGIAPTALAVLAIVVARLPADELAHPLDPTPLTVTPLAPATAPTDPDRVGRDTGPGPIPAPEGEQR